MASTSETGHAKNVANFQVLISFVNGYGANYNPSKAKLKLLNLVAIQATGASDIATVITDNTGFNNKVNDRFIDFSDTKTLSTRLINAFEASDASPQKIKDAKAFNRKIQGKRAKESIQTIDPNTPAPNTISISQQSYDQLIQHLAGLNAVLISETSYLPNETILKTATITAKINSLIARNSDVDNAYTKVSNSRLKRDKTLYAPETGLVEVAAEVKKYVLSLYGASSPEYKQIKGIAFKRNKK